MIEDRYYQVEGVDALFSYFERERGNPLVALPTATGKSVVIARFIERALMQYPMTRIVCLTHVLELVEQNAARMKKVNPYLPVGINCDGLKQRDCGHQIIFGSVGSVLPMMNLIGHVDLFVIDEAHRIGVSEDAEYHQVIRLAREVNPFVKVVGFTATPYNNRGSIVTFDDETGECNSMFTHIAYDRTKPEDFEEFINAGWLCPLVTKPGKVGYDVSKIGVVAGEFNQKQAQLAVDKEELTRQAVSEIIHTAHIDNRHCWLVFGQGIAHAEHLAEEMQLQGIEAACVHSKVSTKKRREIMQAYFKGDIQCVTNNGVLTTGIDHPPIDLIAVVRYTLSIPLWVQMLGRGLRPYDFMNPNQYRPGFEYTKRNTLVLDFGENTSRLGPIDNPYFKSKKKKGDLGDAPMKICQNSECEVYNYASARECYMCGTEFTFETKFSSEYSNESVMSSMEQDEPEWLKVNFVNYEKIQKVGMPAILRVIYHCGSEKHSEFVNVEGTIYARKYAWEWWKKRTDTLVPSSVDDALKICPTLARPLTIAVVKQRNSKYKKVIDYAFA